MLDEPPLIVKMQESDIAPRSSFARDFVNRVTKALPLRTQNGPLRVLACGAGWHPAAAWQAAPIRDSVYGKLLAKSLPRPIRTDAEHAHFTSKLLALDERDDLSAEEEALAGVLTLLIEDYEDKAPYLTPSVAQPVFGRAYGRARFETQRHLARARQQRCRHRGVKRTAFHQQGASQAAGRILSCANRPLHLTQQQAQDRRDAIAAYAEEMAGTEFDLDRALESAAIEHLLNTIPVQRPPE